MHGWMKATMQGGSACGGVRWEEGGVGREGQWERRWEEEGVEVEPERSVGRASFFAPHPQRKVHGAGEEILQLSRRSGPEE